MLHSSAEQRVAPGKHHFSYAYHVMSCQLVVIRLLEETRAKVGAIYSRTTLSHCGRCKLITEGMNKPTNECGVRIIFPLRYERRDVAKEQKVAMGL